MRKEGFYWVKYKGEDGVKWTVSEFRRIPYMGTSIWELHGIERWLQDSDFYEIDETTITRDK